MNMCTKIEGIEMKVIFNSDLLLVLMLWSSPHRCHHLCIPNSILGHCTLWLCPWLSLLA